MDLEEFLQVIPNFITDDDLKILTKSITMEEVKVVVLSFGAFKAPRPDGFPPSFFQVYWEIVSKDLLTVVKDFFRSGKILNKMNTTFLSLVPKSNEVASMNDYRPISLCNTTYKICSKIIINRLKPVLGKMIAINKKGFVQGRKILDATIYTHEILHSMDYIKRPSMVLKLDISKAYDRFT